MSSIIYVVMSSQLSFLVATVNVTLYYFCYVPQTQLRGLENFYAISYLWFILIGVIVTGVVGIIASLIMSKYNRMQPSFQFNKIQYNHRFLTFYSVIYFN